MAQQSTLILLHRWSLVTTARDHSLLTRFRYLPTVPSFQEQVNEEFIPYYAKNKTTAWNPSNSLFATFFGINDVGNSWYLQNATLNDDIFKVYASLMDQVSCPDIYTPCP